MGNVITNPSFFPRRLSQYVPGMQYASDVNVTDNGRISFGPAQLASAAAVISAQSTVAAGSLQSSSFLIGTIPEPWGRNIQFVNTAAGAGTVQIDGYDYLGQPMTEILNFNGTTLVNGVKCFKYFRQVTWTILAANTFNLGTGTRLGLPYKAIKAYTEEVDGTPGTVGTLANPVLSTATSSSGEPRGAYVPNATLNGTAVITATFGFANDVDANNVGGLHGTPHFAL